MPEYSIEYGRRAAKELASLPGVLVQRIFPAIEALGTDPRPHGYKKLKGEVDRYRIRVGQYRVVYSIDEGQVMVRVIRIAHRREAYR